MSPQHDKPTGTPLGEKSRRKHFGHAVHKAGTHTETEHAAAENTAVGVKRLAHKAPSALPKKGGE
jgi:hypothetical protein